MNQQSVVLGTAAAAILAVGMICILPAHSTATTAATARDQIQAEAAQARLLKPKGRACGVKNFSDIEANFVERYVDAMARVEGMKAGQIVPTNTYLGTIPVAFHVIYIDFGFNQTFGVLDPSQVQDQIDALNAAYDNVDFVLAQVDYSNNQDWFLHAPGSLAERAMKTSLAADSNQFLNLYSTGLSFSGLLGYATFPWNRRAEPKMDGVVVSYDTLPGGSAPFDEGDTMVHEVGHWLGLYHTFQGGCRFFNDRVTDTPAEAAAFYGCVLDAPDTCPSSPGSDPINNYMDYSDDACLTGFTPGQVSRMNMMVKIFRPQIID